MKGHEDKYKVLAEKYGITAEEARKICESQFEFTKAMISTGDDLPIRLQYLGKFLVKPGRRATVQARRYILEQRRKK